MYHPSLRIQSLRRAEMNRNICVFLIAQLLLYITSTAAQNIGSLQGTYKPDGKCVPSSTCCCSTGTTTISSEPPNTSVTVSGSLDGGSGCRGFNSLGAVFSVVDSYTATWTVPVYGDKYQAKANNDYTSIVVQRTDLSNPNCINNLSRVSGNAVPAGSSTNTNTNTGSSTNTGTGSSNTGTGSTNTGTGSTNTGTGSGSSTSSGTTTTTSTNALSQENAGNGNFQATSTPLIMSAGSKEGAYQMDTSHLIRFGVLKTTADGDRYDMWLVLEPSSTLFSSAIRGEWATLHYIVPTTEDADTAVMAAPINVPMVVQDGTTQARQWKYSTVRVPQGLGLRFAFSYKMVDGTTITRTPTFFFRSGSAPTSSTSAPTGSTTTSSAPASSSTTTSSSSGSKTRAERWAGTYKVDSSRCKQTSSCCCAQKEIVAKIIPGSIDKIKLDAHLDGSGTCGGMTDVTGDFEYTSDTVATFSYPDSPVKMTAELSSDGQTISFSNSVYECKSYAVKTSASQTSTAVARSSDFESFLGEWRSDNSCKPSANCCCVSGSMYVMTPANAVKLPNYVPPDNADDLKDPNALYAYGNLDGGVACFRRTEMSGVCIIEDTNFGSCVLEGIQFNATRSGQRLTITNSMYQNCESRVVYAGSNTSSDAPATRQAMGVLTYVLLGVTTLAVYVWAIQQE